MLKPQDCMVLVKLLANPAADWSQREMAKMLCISLAEVNGGIKRLQDAGLIRKDNQGKLYPNIHAAEEFLVSGIKFFFPGKLGEYTRGIPTGIAAPLFRDKIALGNDPIPVWPDAVGDKRGVALDPIHPSIPKALRENPDNIFYEIFVLIDVIRTGRPREREMAEKMIREKLNDAK